MNIDMINDIEKGIGLAGKDAQRFCQGHIIATTADVRGAETPRA
jgi:hypothetical protein